MTFRPWSVAMADALYGPTGFFRAGARPARHFRTAAAHSPAFADAIDRLAREVDDRLGNPPDFTIVDMGAGGGELLRRLATRAPARWRLVGVDIRRRPGALPDRIAWLPEPPHGVTGLIVANEWLDNVPVEVVELTPAGPRVVDVDATGAERVGAEPAARDADWLQRWWPLHEVGQRGEVGRQRDHAWTALTSTLAVGLALAIDYAADPRRDVSGTLAAYRCGRRVAPRPDGSCDITAHVLFESMSGDDLTTQRAALEQLGVSAELPSCDGDPTAYAAALRAVNENAALLDRSGWGSFRWLTSQRVAP